jgi:hypothetical protein
MGSLSEQVLRALLFDGKKIARDWWLEGDYLFVKDGEPYRQDERMDGNEMVQVMKSILKHDNWIILQEN